MSPFKKFETFKSPQIPSLEQQFLDKISLGTIDGRGKESLRMAGSSRIVVLLYLLALLTFIVSGQEGNFFFFQKGRS